MIKHNDDSFATMLLMSQISPDREELARPLSTAEWHQLRARVRAAGMSMGELIGMDMSGFMMRLDMAEQEAYRLCLLLSRALPLSMCMERFAASGIEMLTHNERQYPARMRERLGVKAPPLLYLAGRPEVFRQSAIAILGAMSARGDAQERVRGLARMAVEAGYVVVTDGTTGLSRIAQDEAARAGGHVIEIVSGGLAARTRETDMRDMLDRRTGVAMSVVHPDAPHTVSHALLRNKCVYALVDAAFVFAAEKGRGATYEGAGEALQRKWADFVYVWDTTLYAGNHALIMKGATALRDVTPDVFSQMTRTWRGAAARQTCMFDRSELP